MDRIVRELLALGHPAPEIAEIAGPYVRVSLVGGLPQPHVLAFLGSLDPAAAARDVDVLLLLHHLMQRGWVDVARAAPVLQRPQSEAQSAIRGLAETRVQGDPVIISVNGVPRGHPPAYRLNNPARKQLAGATGRADDADTRTAMLLDGARNRGRISSTEAADLADLTVPYAGTLLTKLEGEGALRPGRTERMGRGFFYVPADQPAPTA